MASSAENGGIRRDLVVIGASAGGVETLRTVVSGLPVDLPAAVCVVLHLAPGTPSALAHILERAGRLPCHAAADAQPLCPGEILVAPPDHHMVIEDGCVRLTVGPRENGHRPAVDALFRSAAQARGERVVGVVLSGTRDDGTAGLVEISAAGGGTIIQDPQEAMYAGMPGSALAHVDPDALVPSELVAQAITAMVRGEPLPPSADPAPTADRSVRPDGGETTICPECGGVLTEHVVAQMSQWRCRVGHRYSAMSLLDAQAANVEAALWAAVRALQDRARLLERLAAQLEARGQERSANGFRRRAQEAHGQAEAVRAALVQAASSPLREVGFDNAVDAEGEDAETGIEEASA